MTPELDRMREIIESDRFAGLMGVQLVELRYGYSKLTMIVKENMTNFHSMAHGGAIFALADAAFAAASNSHGQAAVALCMNINYRSPANQGTTLVAEAFEESLGKRTALYHIVVKSDDGRLIASCQGTVYRKDEKLV